MRRKKPKTILLEVTVKQYYGFEEGMINGWSTEKVIENWFKNYNINVYHATRDSHHYGNVDVIKAIKEVTQEELEDEANLYFKELQVRKEEAQVKKNEIYDDYRE